MPIVEPQTLAKLQQNPDRVRNICILAHVDHGKTTLTDSLIATNGIISPKLAGKIRYLDSRADEQIRGITMESSAISLFFSLLRKTSPDAHPEKCEHLINLIDSPGHVDFSSEVSTASRLCDGALVLVDAVEGVCSQTIAVLRQTWIEHLKPVLVINKMDRLVTEWKMSPSEAYSHLSKLVEQVNAVMGSFFQGERMEDDLRWRESLESKVSAASRSKPERNRLPEENDSLVDTINNDSQDASGEWHEKEDEGIYFEPEKGNVIFSSASDGWAFTLKQFAGFYEKKLGIKRALLERVLWGDFYLDPKSKRILGWKHLKGRSLKPLFVQLVLDNIWAIYEAATGGDQSKGDTALAEKITKALSINLPGHILRSRDPRALLTALFSSWIPLSTAVLVSVVEHMPSPRESQSNRVPGLLDESPGAERIDSSVRESMQSLSKERTQPLVAFVSKMVAVPEKDLPENKAKSGKTLTADEARELGRKKRAEFARAQAAANEEHPDVAELREALSSTPIGQDGSEEPRLEEEIQAGEKLIGFARLFSGTLEVGDEVYVLSPKFSPTNPHASPEPQKVTITALYMLMGREMEPLTSVPPGVVFGIAGLEGHVMKSGTLCSQLEGAVNLAGVTMGGQPIVRVALEPVNPMDLSKMVVGMRLLEQSDPCAMYEVLENGEHVILTAGEIHLERCLKDLRERFAKCEIQVGAPIVPYRESIVSASEMNPPRNPGLPRGTVKTTIASRNMTVKIMVRPLPALVTEFLVGNASNLRESYAEQESEEHVQDITGTNGSFKSQGEVSPEVQGKQALNSLKDLSERLKDIFHQVQTDDNPWKDVTSRIVAFGLRRNGANILVDMTSSQSCRSHSIGTLLQRNDEDTDTDRADNLQTDHKDFSDKITYAFQLATGRGPLCQEPLQGVAVILEDITLHATERDVSSTNDSSARFTGEIIKNVRNAIGEGFLDWSPRLLLAMYSCEIQASTEVLGRVYGVVTRRRGRILSESMNEGTPFFMITATIPVAESFGFSEEIRKRTSGAASPQLIFSGFEMLDVDPFWVPFTEEELEDLGELADRENLAKKYMDGVRRRKGLFVQGKKLFESGEKQKTLKR